MRRIVTRRLVLGILALSSMVSAPSVLAQTALERAKDEGFVRMGFANEAPYGFATAAGELTGEAPEIAKIILNRMGIDEVDGVLTQFRSLIPGLKAGRFDIIAAGMFVTPRRCAEVLFSEPTYSIGHAMIVPEGNPKAIHSYEAIIENPELRLGALSGGVAHKLALEIGIPKDQISLFQDGPSGRAAVQVGRIDAWAMTSLAVQRLLDSAGPDSGIERATPFDDTAVERSGRGHGAFAFRKEDKAFRDAFNEHLAAFIGSPEHLELVRRFGFTEAELPTKTTAELCAGS